MFIPLQNQMSARRQAVMSRYRILRMITWLPMGGIERKIVAVLPKLNRDLFEVHLCCIRERGALADSLRPDEIETADQETQD